MNPPLPRLLHICRSFLPLQGGAERHAAHLALAYQELGGETTIVAGRFRKEWPPEEHMFDGRLPVRRIASPRRPRGIGTAVFLTALRRYLVLHRGEYDALLVNFLKYSGMMAGFMRNRLNAPIVVRAEGAGPTGDVDVIHHLPTRRFVRAGLAHVDRLVGVSRRAVQEIVAEGFPEKKVLWIPNGVDCERFHPAENDGRRSRTRTEVSPDSTNDTCILMTLGRLVPIKGIDVLIEALGTLARDEGSSSRPASWRWWVVGDGPEKERLKGMARELGLADRVQFLGHRDDAADLLRAADLYVQPSRSEGLSLALLEAMATGLPVIATRVSGSEDQVIDGENGILVQPEDPGALRQAVSALLSTHNTRRALGSAARHHVVEHCSFPVIARRYADLFQELLQERKGA